MALVTPAQFAASSWLAAMGGQVSAGVDRIGSLDDIQTALIERPDDFFAPPYADPYESWCVQDHEAARKVGSLSDTRVAALAEQAYLTAWEALRDAEFSGLISDDVGTTYTLLLHGDAISGFTLARARWLMRGRAPWGYTGEFPNGRWLVL